MKYLYSVLLLTVFLSACVREVDLQQSGSDDRVLVVDAVLTDGPGPHVIRLTRPANYFNRDFAPVPDATITLTDDEGGSWTYQEVTPASNQTYYQLSGMTTRPGRTYTLDIVLGDGRHYQSTPQTMPQKVAIDSVRVRGERISYPDPEGELEDYKYGALYAYAKSEAARGYLYWEMDAVYQFREYDLPPKSTHTCYVTQYFNKNNLPLYDLATGVPGVPISLRVGDHLIDDAFNWKIGFGVYQRSLTPDAYAYLKKVEALINQTGTVLDPTPAAPVGNIRNLTDANTPALGIFEVTAVDTAYVVIANGELGNEFTFKPDYCKGVFFSQFGVNHYECYDCLSLSRSTYQPPVWWY